MNFKSVIAEAFNAGCHVAVSADGVALIKTEGNTTSVVAFVRSA